MIRNYSSGTLTFSNKILEETIDTIPKNVNYRKAFSAGVAFQHTFSTSSWQRRGIILLNNISTEHISHCICYGNKLLSRQFLSNQSKVEYSHYIYVNVLLSCWGVRQSDMIASVRKKI